MRQAEHALITTEHAAERQRLRTLRKTIEITLEEMIGLLDVLDGDPDLEPEEDEGIDDVPHDPLDEHQDVELGWSNEGSQLRLTGSGFDQEPTLGANECFRGTDHLLGWRGPTTAATDELELENEHGEGAGCE